MLKKQVLIFTNKKETINTPLSLYIHIPWCIKKCPYCDFNSHTLRHSLPETQYIDALITELKQKIDIVQHRPIQSIFLGGGTPSLLNPKSYDRLFIDLSKILQFASNVEITLEANPGTVDSQYFKDYRLAGINRLSLGIQSFQNNKLKQLGRIHDGDTAHCAIDIAQSAGFDVINVDLMYGLPQQSIEQAMNDLQQAINYQTQHISWYQLTLEPNTLFHKYPPTLPHHDALFDIEQQGKQLLKQFNYHQYETSAYAQKSYQCRHNINYWLYGDYLGLGAGAHSKITCFNNGQTINRYVNTKHPNDYLKNANNPIIQQTTITEQELPLEFMMNALRLHQKIDLELFKQRTGLTKDHIAKSLKLAQENGFITIANEAIETTKKGKLFLNDLLNLFN